MTNLDRIRGNREVVQRFLTGTHSPVLSDVDVIDETVSPTVTCHGFPGGDPFDHASYKQFFRTFRSSFTDMEFDTFSLVADETYVSARFRVTVTHTGPFAGVEPTGKRVGFEGMVLYRLNDGKIEETWLQLDQLALLSQIGALPIAA